MTKGIRKVLGVVLMAQAGLVSAAALEEVVVTAQKRTQSAQDVPIAITAMSSEAMREAGVFDVADLTDVNPSISFDTGQSSQNSSLKIRGIGTVGNGRTFEGAVGVFIDGVYRSRSGMALQDMNDIGGLELLRGPQGTLFGKNTVAGALSLNSMKPSIEDYSSSIELLMGNYNKQYLASAVNLPLGDRNAVRMSVVSNRQDGFLRSRQQNDRTYNQTDRISAKFQWLWDVTDNLESWLTLDYSKSDAGCCWGSVQVVSGPLTEDLKYYANLRGLDFYTADYAEDQRLTNNNARSQELREDMGLAWNVQWSLENVDIKSVTGVRQFKDEQVKGDADFGPAHILTLSEPSKIDFWSQELNFSTSIGIVDIVAGVYYSEETYESTRIFESDTDSNNYASFLTTKALTEMLGLDVNTAPICRPPGQTLGCTALLSMIGAPLGIQSFDLFPATANQRILEDGYYQDASSAAVFIHTQTSFDNGFTLVAGARYSEDRKDGGYDQVYWYNSELAQLIVSTGLIGTAPSGDITTPRNALDLNTIYNSPSFYDEYSSSVVTSTVSGQYEFAEDVMGYLTFSKGYKAGAVNLFQEAANLQNTTYDPEYATSWELGLKTRYWEGRAQTNIAVFDTLYENLQINFFNGFNFFTQNTGEATSRGIEIENTVQVTDALRTELNITYMRAEFADLGDAPDAVRHLDGRQTPRAPDLSAVAVATYERPITQYIGGYGRISASYSGEHWASPDTPDEPTQGPYTLWDVGMGFRYFGEREIDVSLFCKNCTDVTYRTIYFAAPVQKGSYNAYINEPRQLGISIKATM
ncbi:TonB-dependent receptor [Spongiibacter sp. KMU-158]|uniref:TonB-dependent receptor n=1 Tax=Spongiibacter pelagi TaxID=2760804 RepID=A0A927C0B9_9GAMM|nr:TonB-dependent receptor [Spongiibacter pelagi]MBD2858913.1 TonB-dependent receptor [Spongiibacter pelagi]